MPNRSVKRGGTPSPRHKLAGAAPYVTAVGAPPTFIMIPQQISMWGNDANGDCVTAEEAFAKACNDPEVFIPEPEVIAWATKHNVLDGAEIAQVMTTMETDGFPGGNVVYDDGPHQAVDWTSSPTLESAISHGPVKIGVAANQLETAWHTTEATGWFATGFTRDDNEDHCVSLCGYGPISWLADQLGAQVPDGADGSNPGYALFTWNSIGVIDVPSMLAITHEAWVRSPTTVERPSGAGS